MGDRGRDLVVDAALGAALTGRAVCLGAQGIRRERKRGPLRVCALPGAPPDRSPSDKPKVPVGVRGVAAAAVSFCFWNEKR